MDEFLQAMNEQAEYGYRYEIRGYDLELVADEPKEENGVQQTDY